MKTEKNLEEQLAQLHPRAPEDFTARVMAALPPQRSDHRAARIIAFWPAHGRWIMPALAGAAASLLLVLTLGRPTITPPAPTIATTEMTIRFELFAPAAERVELLGTFNDWQSGNIVLTGPDATGYWTAKVPLPEGRHEYAFLVDGERWLADPAATTRRPDGFGRENTIIQVYNDEEEIHS